MAKSEYTFEGSKLEEWLEKYLEDNGNIARKEVLLQIPKYILILTAK